MRRYSVDFLVVVIQFTILIPLLKKMKICTTLIIIIIIIKVVRKTRTFQATNKRNLTRENVEDVVKKGKLWKRNWISSDNSTKQRHKDYVRARINKTQQNSRYSLCAKKDEMINHIISECSKLAPKEYTTRERWSTGNRARSLNLTIRTNGICTTKNLS